MSAKSTVLRTFHEIHFFPLTEILKGLLEKLIQVVHNNG